MIVGERLPLVSSWRSRLHAGHAVGVPPSRRAQPPARPSAGAHPDHRRPVHGDADRLRRHAHCGHQSGDRRRRGRGQPREVLIDGKGAGTVSLDRLGREPPRPVRRGRRSGNSSPSNSNCTCCFPGEDIQVTANDDAVVLHGRVSSNEVSLRVAEIAGASASKAKLINMLELPGGSESQQVLLQVRVAEVNRRALTEAGLNLFAVAAGLCGTLDDAAVCRAGLRRQQSERRRRAEVQRFPQPVLLQPHAGYRRRAEGARVERIFPDARRAEPDCLQRTGGQLSGRRRVPDSGRPGRDRHGDGDLQGIRRQAELHAAHRRRHHPPQGPARGQLARLQQRHHARRVSAFRPRSPDAPKPTSSCATGSRSRSPDC